ncbi:hypothetical protein [Planctomicrobium piriforme]|uniref:Soil-associated protein, TIGR03435 family n=1 Tax=Planctomicrobium piriforme TaxID=1576369 RepID=A0A1I3AV27_9PLAN|nr:hypothetical protein [Planctomicrobium piriforme]SFH53646.1 hypothetical protein SAMN05421753_10163 [Planctomicrobium piriforme]
MRWFVLKILFVCWLGSTILPGLAQAQPTEYSPDKTLLEIEILLPQGPGDPLLAQKWRQEFERIGEAVRIRQPLADEKVAISEKPRGPFRVVKVTGAINRDGVLIFPGKTFKPGQSEQMKMWLTEIKTYGAQGSPQGQPRYGLTEPQFKTLFEQLTPPVADPLKGLSIAAAIEKIPLPAALSLNYHSTAAALQQSAGQTKLEDEVQGLSTGTALAYVLSQQGLAFRPLRTPTGQIQLLIQPLADVPDAWPVGWPVDETRPRNEIVPGLFKTVDTGVQTAPLSIVLDAIEDRTGVRLLVDLRASLAKQLDPRQTTVSYPKKYTAWSLIVSSVVVNAHLTMTYRQDEAGTGFVWITPFAHYVPPAVKSKPN